MVTLLSWAPPRPGPGGRPRTASPGLLKLSETRLDKLNLSRRARTITRSLLYLFGHNTKRSSDIAKRSIKTQLMGRNKKREVREDEQNVVYEMGNEIGVLREECAKKRVLSERKIARLLDIKDYLNGDFTLRCVYNLLIM